MTRSKARRKNSATSRRPNVLAVCIAVAAIGVLYVNFDPPPAGAGGTSGAYAAPVAPPPPMAVTVGEHEGENGDAAAADERGRSQAVQGRPALLMQLLLLEKGIERLSKVPSYTATLHKQERVDHVLGERQTVEMKVRHEPFSVYMKWLSFDPGRELLYVQGQNDGNMIVHAGGWKARLVPALNLDPHGSMAMRESRYPVTMAGLLAAARKMCEFRRTDLGAEQLPVRCAMHFGQRFEGRPCYCFVIESLDPAYHAGFRKTIAHIDEELCLPVCIRNYAWPIGEDEEQLAGEPLDEATLIEFYTYTNIGLDNRLADADFDRANGEYRFKR
ncbi:MAG: DUF1571 domain-containing protein [Planctomycetaceae bacterium]